MKSCDDCCFAKLLKVIDILQRNASGNLCSDASCTRPFLGSITNSQFNTRPVQFYTCAGSLFSTEYTSGDETVTSNVFRVEQVDGCCCKCRILADNSAAEDPTRMYTATNQYITINLNCVCAVSCLTDIIIDNL